MGHPRVGAGGCRVHRVLLPGGMCSATVFEDIAAALHGAPVRFVGATLPGFGRTPHPMDLSIENYAALAARLADDVGADIVGGHSLGGNVALEMAAAGQFDGPVLLLSPSFSREDESAALGRLDRVGRVPGLGGLGGGRDEGDATCRGEEHSAGTAPSARRRPRRQWRPVLPAHGPQVLRIPRPLRLLCRACARRG